MKEGWEYKKLGEVATIINGKNQKAVENENGEYPICGSGGIMGYATDYLCPEQTVIVGRKGNINRPIFMEQKFWNVDTAFGIIANNLFLLPKFLFYFCVDFNFESLNKAVTIPSLVKSDLLKIQIFLPPLSEQQHIVEELDLLSSIIEKKKAQLKELDNLAQSIFYEMFGDPITNEKGWKIKPFKEIASFKNGLNYHPTDNGQIIKCIGVGDFQDKKELREFDQIKVFSINEVVDESYYLQDGDIIIVRSNGSRELVGRNMIIYPNNEKITYSGFCIRCRIFTTNILPIILNRILSNKSTMIVLRQEGRGCNISNINQKILSSLPIITPPIVLQYEYVQKVQSIEHQKALIKQSITEVETLFNSRMDYYFN